VSSGKYFRDMFTGSAMTGIDPKQDPKVYFQKSPAPTFRPTQSTVRPPNV